MVIGLSVLLVHLPEKQHLRHISGFSRELVCRVHLGSIGGSHILPPCTTCLESKVTVESNPLLLWSIVEHRRGYGGIDDFPSQGCVDSKGDASPSK